MKIRRDTKFSPGQKVWVLDGDEITRQEIHGIYITGKGPLDFEYHFTGCQGGVSEQQVFRTRAEAEEERDKIRALQLKRYTKLIGDLNNG